jgi:predicted dehydrogenase
MNRRRFLTQSAAASATALGFPAITSCASPNSFLQVASVGVARMGGNTMRSVASHPKVKIVALCDVDDVHMSQAVKDFPEATKHKHWRDLLAKNADSFDAITVGIPDHMHASVAITALRAKKPVYLQKPMAPTVHECRVLAAEAAKAGVATQLGNQGRSTIEGRMMVELMKSEAVGKIKEIVFWENKKLNWWPKNTELRPQSDAIPATFDWEAWTGVSASRPYLDQTYHPQTWRAWHDFGCGELGDMGCHHFDSSVDGLKLSPPKRVRQIFTGPQSKGMWAASRAVEFEFSGAEHSVGGEVKLTWLDGEYTPELAKIAIPLPKGISKMPPSGGLWIGEKGTIFKPYGARPFVTLNDGSAFTQYPADLGKRDHYHDWVDAILDNRPACDPFSHGANLTEIVVVGTLAEQTPGEWLSWDAATMKSSSDAVNSTLVRSYREGWKIEGLG